MSRTTILAAIAAAVLTAVSMLAWQHRATGPDKDHDAAVHAKAEHAQAEEVSSGLSLDKEALERAGIQTAAVTTVSLQTPFQAIATVLPIQELIDSAASIAAAKAQAERASAALIASGRDHERMKSLHAQDRNVSDRALETAEAAWRADEAGAQAAQATLDATKAGARGRWGHALAESLAERGPLWHRLEVGQTVLLRVVASLGASPNTMPPLIVVEDPSGQARQARWLSAAPIADSRIQGRAFFYTMDTHDAAPGMVLTARFTAGRQDAGALLPLDALLWWQGKQWGYIETAPGRFERREALAARRQDNGWFVPGFPASTVVSRGAQALLSQELHSAIKVGEEAP